MKMFQSEILFNLMLIPIVTALGVTAFGLAIQHKGLANLGFHALISFILGFGLALVIG